MTNKLNLKNHSKQKIIRVKRDVIIFLIHCAKQPWIVHGFNKNRQIALDLIRYEICLSFGESLLKNKKLQETFSKLPLEFVFFETDTSEEHIENIYNIATELRKTKKEEIINTVKHNFNRIFKR